MPRCLVVFVSIRAQYHLNDKLLLPRCKRISGEVQDKRQDRDRGICNHNQHILAFDIASHEDNARYTLMVLLAAHRFARPI
jgi:hypothetical protein